jgi:hypothetical protein
MCMCRTPHSAVTGLLLCAWHCLYIIYSLHNVSHLDLVFFGGTVACSYSSDAYGLT